MYIEPANYFPEEILKECKLGPYAKDDEKADETPEKGPEEG